LPNSSVGRWSETGGKPRRAELTDFLKKFVVLPADDELCRKWAEVSFACRRLGRPIQTADACIAATALLYRVPLITHNGADYQMVECLTVISELS
jgi:tRNA(fMet)-specific endonuclease VapC